MSLQLDSQVNSMVQRCWTPRTGFFDRQFFGTTADRMLSVRSWSEYPNSAKSPAIWRCPASQLQSCCGLRNTNRRFLTRSPKCCYQKDYLRFRLSGTYMSDASDAAGTLWLDVKKRKWSKQMLEATGLNESQMPEVREGGGDNAAGAVGVGIVKNGQAMLSIGTSGVYFAVSDGFKALPDAAVHSFCHALTGTWHLMSVMLNSANCLDFTARLTGFADVPALLEAAEKRGLQPNGPLFLPYLTGERTPHNDAHLRGSFTGLGPKTDRADLANATLEGVGLGLLDGYLAVESTGCHADEITVIGGGSRSAYWTQMLADILGRRLVLRAGGEVGPALGAARLARLAVEPETPIDEVCPMPEISAIREPNAERHDYFQNIRHPLFRRAHAQLQPLYAQQSNE
ncbi:hypothetical protein M3Y94_00958200 [Aphelenchoides besseyi]|nr:hypothetical protein M3Y94_00958200 [Aphelenchoides besseyi]